MRRLSHEEISRDRLTEGELESAPRFPIYVLLDNIRSLYNVGSIFRTSDGARISKLYLAGYTPRPPRKEIEKTALGSTRTVPWEYVPDPLRLISLLASEGIPLCVLEHTDTSIPYYAVPPGRFPLCLAVGNELTGVSREIVSRADFAVDIPMYGMKQSLNAAVAYGIAVFEFVRKINANTASRASSVTGRHQSQSGSSEG